MSVECCGNYGSPKTTSVPTNGQATIAKRSRATFAGASIVWRSFRRVRSNFGLTMTTRQFVRNVASIRSSGPYLDTQSSVSFSRRCLIIGSNCCILITLSIPRDRGVSRYRNDGRDGPRCIVADFATRGRKNFILHFLTMSPFGSNLAKSQHRCEIAAVPDCVQISASMLLNIEHFSTTHRFAN